MAKPPKPASKAKTSVTLDDVMRKLENVEAQMAEMKGQMATKSDLEELRVDMDRKLSAIDERIQVVEIRSMAAASAQAAGLGGISRGYSLNDIGTAAMRDSLRRRRSFL